MTPTSKSRWREYALDTRDALAGAADVLLAAPTIVLLCLLGAAASCVAGVYHLAGFGWALIALSAWLALIATVLSHGMRDGA